MIRHRVLSSASLRATLTAAACACSAACIPSSNDVDGGPDDRSSVVHEARDAGARGSDGDLQSTYPPARTTVVPRVGSADALEVGAWNLRNFPTHAQTPALTADLVASMDVDILGVEEIASVDAFDELVARLPAYDSVLSTDAYGDGTYQKIGFLYRRGLVSLTSQRQLFTDQGFDFPRPPLEVTFVIDDGARAPRNLTVIDVHLKAGREHADFQRRQRSTAALESYVRSLVDGPGGDQIIVQGDFNENLDIREGRENFAPFLDAARYTVETLPVVDAQGETFLPAHIVIDHIVATKALAESLLPNNIEVPPLDEGFAGYMDDVSDHLPVILHIPFAP